MLFFHLSLHIWMFHNQTLNNRIDKLQERALRLDLFIIYIRNLLFFIEEENVTSYADHTTPYSNGKNVATVLENIETKGKDGFSWFSINYQKVSTLTNFKS